MVTRKQPGYSTIPLDQSYSASTPYSPWSGLSDTLGNIGNSSNLTMGAAQSPAVPYQQSMLADKFNFNTPGYGQMAAYGPPAPMATAMPAVSMGTGAAESTTGAAEYPWSFDLFSGIGDTIKGAAKDFGDFAKSSGMIGSTDPVTKIKTDGWLGGAMQGADSLFKAYNSMQTFGLAKEMFESQKQFANANLQNGQKSYNTQIEGRQRAMAAGNPNAESVDSYMAKHRLG